MAQARTTTPPAMDGYRFQVERNRLCIWLESERAKLAGLSAAERTARDLELEQEFRLRLDALYSQAAPSLAADCA